MSELCKQTLNNAWRAAWRAVPLEPFHELSRDELALFNYGRDCAVAAIKGLEHTHPILSRLQYRKDCAEAAATLGYAAQGMSAGTAKTAQPVEGKARQPGPRDAPKTQPKAPR